MSYDVSFKIHTGRIEFEIASFNYTSNVAEMFSMALGMSLKDLDGELAANVSKTLELAVEHMKANPDEYRKLNSPNGWGSYEGALQFMTKITETAWSHPATRIYVDA